jgi:hypothetical protein
MNSTDSKSGTGLWGDLAASALLMGVPTALPPLGEVETALWINAGTMVLLTGVWAWLYQRANNDGPVAGPQEALLNASLEEISGEIDAVS